MLAPMTSSSELLTRAVETVLPKQLAEEKLASGKPLRIYLGIDPTGTKLHLGHSVPLRKLQAFANAGHKVFFLIGSFTAIIGDPTGRDKQREPLSLEQVKNNFLTYKEQASKILDFSKIEVVYNHEWLEKLSFADITNLASNFTVQQMEERDMFAKRIQEGKPLGLHEFFYPLMQGYDSVMLDVDCEIGGNDQLFNMLAGRTLQKALGKREKCILAGKLIAGLDGRKMSKTYDNCVYLEDAPNDMFGKMMSLGDDLMQSYFECCTDVDLKESAALIKADPRAAKAHLAREIVTLYHSAEAAIQAEEAFNHMFQKGGLPEEMPEVQAKKNETLIDLLVRTKTVSSRSDAKRLIEQKGIALNDEIVTTIDQAAAQGVVRVGKRKFVRIVL